MKKRSVSAFAGTILLGVSLAPAAGYLDITVFDGLEALHPLPTNSKNGLFGSKFDPRFPNNPKENEFNEVENGNAEYPSWDLRAFGYNSSTNTLIYQGGMDISTEHTDNLQTNFSPVGSPTTRTNATHYGIGSIFIKLGPNTGSAPPIWSNDSTNPSTSGDYGNLVNSALPNGGFDYAISLRSTVRGTLSYEIYALSSTSILTMPKIDVNDEAGPYAYIPEKNSPQLPIFGGTAAVEGKSSTDIDNDFDDLQGFGLDNYIAEFKLTGLTITPGTYFYLTQECGNDSMVGLVPVPEPAGMVGLMGLLLSGAFLRSRRCA